MSISSESVLKVIYKGKIIIYNCRHADISDNVFIGDTFKIECYSKGKISFWMYKFRNYQYSEEKNDTLELNPWVFAYTFQIISTTGKLESHE